MSPLVKSLQSLVRRLQPVDLLAHYECEVLSQNDDGTLEVRPQDERLGQGLSRVQLDLGQAVESVKVLPGARVMVSFRNGNQELPRATWVKGDILELVIKAKTKITIDAPQIEIGKTATSVALGKGLKPVASVGDKTTNCVVGSPVAIDTTVNQVVKV